MKNRYLIIGITALIIISAMMISTGSNNETVATKPLQNVMVESTIEEEYNVSLDYVGVVKARETRNYAFITGGKIKTMNVEKGDFVHQGDTLATLDTVFLELSRQSAVVNLNNVSAMIDASKISLETLESVTKSSEALHNSGALSDLEWEAKQAEYEMQKASFENLKGNYQMSKYQLASLDENITDATLIADSDGYVMELPYNENEIVGPGAPVVIMKSIDHIVTIGISIEDFTKIEPSTQVLINDNIHGEVVDIAAYPDENDRTYAVDIQFESDEIALGQTVDVRVINGTEKGIFVPISSIFTIDGIDYVYRVSEEGLVSKQKVELGEISSDRIRVKNMSAGILVVTEDIKSLKENDRVTIMARKVGSVK